MGSLSSLKEEMNSSNWEDIDLIEINNFINEVDLENIQDPFSIWKTQNQSIGADADILLAGATYLEKECAEVEGSRKRARAESSSCNRTGTKACREKFRRDKLNERFAELCAILEPGRAVKTDKIVILGDAIRVLKRMKSEVVECKDTNQKLSEEIQTLKAEKNELREEKLKLKADKEKIEQQLRALPIPTPPGFMAPHPAAAYHAEMNKMAVFPGYNFVPMIHYLPSSTRDTSCDHEFRPPAA